MDEIKKKQFLERVRKGAKEKGTTDNIKKLTSGKAIRLKCLDCTCYSPNEVQLCEIKDCTLWPFRLGHRPKEQPFYKYKR